MNFFLFSGNNYIFQVGEAGEDGGGLRTVSLVGWQLHFKAETVALQMLAAPWKRMAAHPCDSTFQPQDKGLEGFSWALPFPCLL